MTGISYATSAEMAKELGPFPGYAKNKDHMLRVMRNHRRAAYGAAVGYEAVRIAPVPLDETDCPDGDLIAHARKAWDLAVELGEAHGYRNAQATVVAPTGTIGLVMDCDTTGIEAGFRAGEVQEAGRRRLFQDHQRAVPEALRTGL
jgi:ribonucleoside-diphosphate reductase alpha chain